MTARQIIDGIVAGPKGDWSGDIPTVNTRRKIMSAYIKKIIEKVLEGARVEISDFGFLQIVKKKSKFDYDNEEGRGRVFENKYPGYYFNIILDSVLLNDHGFKFSSSPTMKKRLYKLLTGEDCSQRFELYGE